MRPTSLRAKLTLLAVAAVAIVLTIAAVLIVVVQRGQLLQNIDDSLDREAADVIAALGIDPSFMPGARGDDRFIQIIDDDGSVIAASSTALRLQPLADPGVFDLDRAFARSTSSDVPIEDDQYRLLTRWVVIDGDRLTIVVGENTDDLRDSVWGLAGLLAAIVPLTTAILGATAWFMVGRTLSPVASIEREVSHITLHRLGDRVPVPDSQDEIAELAVTMNAMLDRLDHANERQQHFVADASHELRSPLTRLRTSLEVDLADPARDLNVTGHELLGDVEDLQTLVNDLLFLARTDGEPRLEMTRVDLDAVVDRAVELVDATGEAHIDTHALAAVEVRGNESHLLRLVTNLVNNGLRYAQEQIWIEADEHDGVVNLVIEDDGPGIADVDRERVFERFTRLDASRTGATGGAGLGLAIAREIVDAHAGAIQVESGRTGGARFVVTLNAWDHA